MSNKDKKNRYFYLSQSLKKIGKYVGRGKKRSIAKAVVENSTLRDEVIFTLGRAVRKEISNICSDSHDSILRMKSKTAMKLFCWERIWLELQMHSPLLVALLIQLVPPSKHKAFNPALCVCASIFLKMHNDLFQAMVALILRAGHATKQVC